jgi:hypothetical protein
MDRWHAIGERICLIILRIDPYEGGNHDHPYSQTSNAVQERP